MILAEAKKTCSAAERVGLHHSGLKKAYDLQNVKNPVCTLPGFIDFIEKRRGFYQTICHIVIYGTDFTQTLGLFEKTKRFKTLSRISGLVPMKTRWSNNYGCTNEEQFSERLDQVIIDR